MVTLSGVKADDKNCIIDFTVAAYYIITTGYWKSKSCRDIVKIPIGYAHAPYKTVNIGDMILVGIFCKHGATVPRLLESLI